MSKYLVGYRGKDQCLYGEQLKELYEHIDPLTLSQAKKLAKKIFCWANRRKIKSVVYKLVEIKNKK